MIFLSWILTFFLVVNCGLLVLLVLVQLPKKDAGAGLAFGGGAVDAVFGAGSGNALTKITKWAILLFVVLTVGLGTLEVKLHTGGSTEFQQNVESQQTQSAAPQVQPGAAQPSSSGMPAATPSTPASTPVMPLLSATNALPSTTTSTNGK
jgi:protein translocase SecG subunit